MMHLAIAKMTTRQPLIVCLVIAVALAVSNGETDAEYYARYEEAVKHVMKQVNMSSQDFSTWNADSFGSTFNCPIDPNYKPSATTVNELTPYDIKVVGAMGDSITAAFGANSESILDTTEYRGVSWSIGGDGDLSTVTTLPNIIKKYNPAVKGFSVGTGNAGSTNAHFNRAISGAKADGMYGQAEDLVEKIKADETINFKDDWKLVTLWIGGNDLCQFCQNNKLTPENYVDNIERGLNYLRENMTRTFVNVVQIIDIEKLSETSGLVCDAVHWLVCPCKKTAKDMSLLYQKKLEEMIAKPENKDKDDFAVVLQPFMKGVEIPRTDDDKVDMSFFAPDCFHFSGKGHAEGAIALWNNMIQKVGEKNQGWNFSNTTIECPKDYFYTRGNSFSLSDSNPHQQESGSPAIIAGSVMGVVVVAGAAIALVIVALVVLRRQSAAESTPLLDS